MAAIDFNSFFKLLLSFGVLIHCAAGGYQQSVKLYKNINCQGIPFETTGWVLKFPLEGWDDAIYSGKILGGWIFYGNEYWNKDEKSLVEYLFSSSEACYQFQLLGGDISSFQYVGNRTNYKRDSLTIYKELDFQGGYGGQAYIDAALNYIELDTKRSLVITGSEPWTLYEKQDYKGDSICITPPASKLIAPYFVPDLRKAGIPFNFPASAMSGCKGLNEDHDYEEEDD